MPQVGSAWWQGRHQAPGDPCANRSLLEYYYSRRTRIPIRDSLCVYTRISFWISRVPLFTSFEAYQRLSPCRPTPLTRSPLWSQSSATPPLAREGDAYKLVRTRARPDADVMALLPPQETIQSTVTSEYGYVGHAYAQTSPASWDYTHFGVSLRAPRDLMAWRFTFPPNLVSHVALLSSFRSSVTGATYSVSEVEVTLYQEVYDAQTVISRMRFRRGSAESFTQSDLPPPHSSVWAFLPLRKSSTPRSSHGGIRGACGFRVWPDLTLPDSGFSPSSVRCRQTPLRDANRQAFAHPSRQLRREAQFAEAPESQRTYTPLYYH